jgi:hypothetical protein
MKRIICIASALALFSACSVVMASKTGGTNISKVSDAHTKAQFQAMSDKILSSEKLPSGELVETYLFTKEHGSIARACMHGLLDLSTLGIWEIAGTPIEGNLNQPDHFVVKVTYGSDDIAKKVELQ